MSSTQFAFFYEDNIYIKLFYETELHLVAIVIFAC